VFRAGLAEQARRLGRSDYNWCSAATQLLDAYNCMNIVRKCS